MGQSHPPGHCLILGTQNPRLPYCTPRRTISQRPAAITYFFDAAKKDGDEADDKQVHIGRLVSRLQEIRRIRPQVYQAISRMVAAVTHAEE